MIKLTVEDEFCDRIERQLTIESEEVTLKTLVLKSGTCECTRLALNLIQCGYSLLSNHELYKNTEG